MDNEQQAQQNQYASAAGRTEEVRRPNPSTAAQPTRAVHLPKLGVQWRWVAAGVAVLLIAGATFAAWNYFNSPQRIIGHAFGKLAGVKTMHFDATATSRLKGFGELGGSSGSNESDQKSGSDLQEAGGEDDLGTSVSVVQIAKAAEGSEGNPEGPDASSPVDFSLGIRGVTDVSNPDEVKTAATVTMAGKVAKVTLLGVGLDVKAIGSTGYVRLGDLTDVTGLNSSQFLDPLKGQWIKIDERDVNEAANGTSLEGESTEEAYKLPDREKINRLTKAAEKSKLITFKKLKDDSIDGQSAHHYGYTIDKRQLEAFIPEASQIIGDKPLSEDEIKEIAEIFNSFDFRDGEMWIGKQDMLPHKITLGLKSNSEYFDDIILSVSMKDFDKPVKIEAPEDAKTFQEVEQQFMDEQIGDSSVQPRNLTDPKDSDGDGHTDAEEIRKGFNPYGPGRATNATPAPSPSTNPRIQNSTRY